jgi:NAD(P)-dependent dehydrogenase (short-subunit alcohol dehydrogenase family)
MVQYPDSDAVPDYKSFLSLADRGFVVLGAGQGMGRQSCHALSQAGARVLCVDRDPALAEAIAREVKGIPCAANVTDRADMERIIATAKGEFGTGFAGLVDIVGVASIGPLSNIDDAAWNSQFDIVLRHAYLAIQIGGAALAERGGGSMIFVGSISGVVSVAAQAAYGTAKAALHHLVQCAAHEMGSKGVRINAVAPGFVRTPRLLKMLGEEFWDGLSAHVPMGRVAVPADVASAILFLASDQARYVTGNIMTLDGGTSVTAALPEIKVKR